MRRLQDDDPDIVELAELVDLYVRVLDKAVNWRGYVYLLNDIYILEISNLGSINHSNKKDVSDEQWRWAREGQHVYLIVGQQYSGSYRRSRRHGTPQSCCKSLLLIPVALSHQPSL